MMRIVPIASLSFQHAVKTYWMLLPVSDCYSIGVESVKQTNYTGVFLKNWNQLPSLFCMKPSCWFQSLYQAGDTLDVSAWFFRLFHLSDSVWYIFSASPLNSDWCDKGDCSLSSSKSFNPSSGSCPLARFLDMLHVCVAKCSSLLGKVSHARSWWSIGKAAMRNPD